MNHIYSVFTNSCLRVPVDPVSKMPKTIHERKIKPLLEQSSEESTSTGCPTSPADIEADKLKEFYQSIPDYKDINHLSTDEFYSTLKNLRNMKNKMMCNSPNNISHQDDPEGLKNIYDDFCTSEIKSNASSLTQQDRIKINNRNRHKITKLSNNCIKKDYINNNRCPLVISKIDTVKNVDQQYIKATINQNSDVNKKYDSSVGALEDKSLRNTNDKILNKNATKPKRNLSACSISWDDTCKIKKDETDVKFKKFFNDKSYDDFGNGNPSKKSQSVPSSPIKQRRNLSPTLRRRTSITIPKPFKMTERDEDYRKANQLRCIQKSFSEDMLHQKCDRKQFRARPVPIESRIPLYEKILEDQAMRRAITKINSEAELRAQMKLFSFTKREESSSPKMPCEKVTNNGPKLRRKKRFKARPVPKNLFSNYIYDKMREDEFFRSLNRRIRAEELLRRSAAPGNMAARDSRLSTPAAHSDLPRDPSPAVPSATPSDRPRTRSPVKTKKRDHNNTREDFITTSPLPFRFNTAERAAKKMLEATKKLYQCGPKTPTSGVESDTAPRAYSALELRAHSTGRSNLAALLRVENVKRRFDMEASRRSAEQRRRIELRTRDRILRSKPAWHLVKNNHEEDIAMRLQTRRDEEKMRHEEFLHEMELMYGRVLQQPLLFERYYAPRSFSAPMDSIKLSPRKRGKSSSRKYDKSYHYNSPNRSRKVSINEVNEEFDGDVSVYLNRIDNNDKLDLESEAGTDILDGIK